MNFQVRASAFKFIKVSNAKCLIQQVILVETYGDLNLLVNFKSNKHKSSIPLHL